MLMLEKFLQQCQLIQRFINLWDFLHGGASWLIESVGSAASFLFINQNSEVRGIEISANHLKQTQRDSDWRQQDYS
jgi:acyl-coenzyme A thioesterase PaaI-like protein